MQLHYIVYFGNYREISVPNSIAEEPLSGATRLRCIIFTLVLSEMYLTFYTNTYPALFVSLEYIHPHHFGIY